MDDKEKILNTLEHYQDAYNAKDLDRLMTLFGGECEPGVIGTGGDEYLFGRDAVRGLFARNFAETDEVDYGWGDRHVDVLADFAWVQARATVSGRVGEKRFNVPLRWTIVLAEQDGRWRWLHRHSSVAASAQKEGVSYPKSTS